MLFQCVDVWVGDLQSGSGVFKVIEQGNGREAAAYLLFCHMSIC